MSHKKSNSFGIQREHLPCPSFSVNLSIMFLYLLYEDYLHPTVRIRPIYCLSEGVLFAYYCSSSVNGALLYSLHWGFWADWCSLEPYTCLMHFDVSLRRCSLSGFAAVPLDCYCLIVGV